MPRIGTGEVPLTAEFANGVFQFVVGLTAPFIDANVTRVPIRRIGDAIGDIRAGDFQQFVERGTDTKLASAAGIGGLVKFLG